MPKLISDKFTRMRCSRQERYQLRRKAAGECRQCAEKVVKGVIICETCRRLNTERMRQKRLELKALGPIMDLI